MAGVTDFWEPVSDRSAALTPSDIARWERDCGVRLPPILAQSLLVQNGGNVRGVALSIEPLDGFTSLDDEQWEGVWEDGSQTVADRGRQFHIGESTGVGVVLDYMAGSEPRVLLLHHGQGRELRDHGIGSFEELLQVARLDNADPGAQSDPTPAPQSSLWVTSVGPNFAKVFAVVRRVMGVTPSEAKALLSGSAFRVAAGWPSELRPWREALREAGATAEIR
jgi:hypothetical protein